MLGVRRAAPAGPRVSSSEMRFRRRLHDFFVAEISAEMDADLYGAPPRLTQRFTPLLSEHCSQTALEGDKRAVTSPGQH